MGLDDIGAPLGARKLYITSPSISSELHRTPLYPLILLFSLRYMTSGSSIPRTFSLHAVLTSDRSAYTGSYAPTATTPTPRQPTSRHSTSHLPPPASPSTQSSANQAQSKRTRSPASHSRYTTRTGCTSSRWYTTPRNSRSTWRATAATISSRTCFCTSAYS
jgi:hypothetical protein